MKKIFFLLLFLPMLLKAQIGIFPTPDAYQFLNGMYVGDFGNLHITSDGDLDTIKGLSYDWPDTYSGTAKLYLRLNPVDGDLTWSKLKKADFDDFDASEVVFGAWDASGGAQTYDGLKFTSDLALEFYETSINMSNGLSLQEWNIGYDNNGSYGIYSTYPADEADFSYILKDWTSTVAVNHGLWVDKTTHNVTVSNILPSNFSYAFNVYDGFGVDENGLIRNYAGTGIEDGDILMGQASDNSYRPLELLGSGGVSISYTEGVGLTIDGSGAGGGGSVTSVDLAITNLSGVGATTSVTGSPVTSSGTITLNIPDAAIAVQRGLVTNGTQTFEGDKTFNNTVDFNDDATFLDLAWFGTNKTKIDGNGRIYLYNNVTPAAGMLLKGDGTDFKTLSLGSAKQVLSVNTGATDAEWGTVSSLLDINAVTSETIIDVDDDKLIMYDASEGANNSVTIEELFNEYAASYRNHSFDYYNEFINGVGTATGGNDVVSVSSGTGASSTGTAATNATNTIGLVTSTTGTTATGRTAIATYSSSVALGGGTAVYEYRINGIANLSDVTNRYALLVGFYDTQSGVNQVDGVYFLYDEGGVSMGSAASANWQTVTVSNSTRTFNTTSTAVATTGTTLKIVVNAAGTQVDYYIDGAITATSHTTNIPTGTARALGFGVLLIKSTGTTARVMNSDYISVNILYTTPKN